MEAEIRIERYADQGRCVGRIDGRVVFVRFALPGELVRITLDEPHDRDDRFWTGEVTEVLEASADRVDPVWPLAGPLAMGGGVGGADLVHVSLPGQLRWKSATITEQMRRLGHQTDLGPVAVEREGGDEAEQGLHWRTRIEMIADGEGRPSMRRRGTHVRVPIDTMPLATHGVLDVAGLEHVWEGGFEPGAQIRLAVPASYGAGTASVAGSDAVEASAAGTLPPSPSVTRNGAAPLLSQNSPRDCSVSQREEKGRRAAGAENYAVLVDGELKAGSSTLKELVRVDGREFAYNVEASGFWQIHRAAPSALASHVLTLVKGALNGASSAVLWDLYSGSGLFTLPLAVAAAPRTRMLSIEGAKQAVKSAQRNLRELGLENVDARAGDVERTLRHVPAHLAHPDVVVLDPPRAGARAAVCRQIAAAGPKAIVYVACDPTSLARDTGTLTAQGYRLVDVRAHDIYPNTHHVETVALFER